MKISNSVLEMSSLFFENSIFQAELTFFILSNSGRRARFTFFLKKIVIFILQIIKQRIWRHTYQEGLVWNSDPGALLTLPEFSDSLSHFPFHFGEEQQQLKAAAATGCEKFTAVIYTTLTSASTSSKVASGVHLSAPIFKLARNVAASNFAQQVIK